MSSKGVVLRRSARLELVQQFRWLEGRAGPDTAERFLSAADASFAELLAAPYLGPEAGSQSPDLFRLRKWRVNGFPNALIFYLPRQDGIQIVRVLSASADWQSLFDAD